MFTEQQLNEIRLIFREEIKAATTCTIKYPLDPITGSNLAGVFSRNIKVNNDIPDGKIVVIHPKNL